MDRRKFLEIGSAGSIGFAAVPDVMLPAAAAESRPPVDVDEFLKVLDRGMDKLKQADLLGRAAQLAPGELVEERKIVMDAVRSLYFTGMVGDLPLEAQTDARVQARLWQMAPEIDESVAAMIRHLEMRTSSEWADLQTALRHRSDPAMQITEMLVDEGAFIGLSPSRLRQTRMLITHASRRLRNQPGEVVVREYLDKMHKVVESDALDDMARRRLAAKAGEALFWQDQEQTQEKKKSPKGLKTLGWGLAILAGGALLVAIGDEGGGTLLGIGLVGMTVGVITILVGLIQLLVHASRN